MPDFGASDPLTRNLTIRVTEKELAQIEELRKDLQTRAGPHVRVTQRMVILEALDALIWRQRDRERKR